MVDISPFSVRLLTSLFVSLFLCASSATLADSSDSTLSYSAQIQSASTDIANEDYSSAFSSYLLAIKASPNDPQATADIMTLTESNAPQSIDLTLLLSADSPQLPFSVSYQNTEVGPKHAGYKTLFLTPNDPLTADENDPVESWPFSRATYIYSTRDGITANHLCTVYYQSQDSSDLGHKIGALLSLLDDVYAQRMHAARADDSYPFNVWLCSAAPVSNGGEQWQNNIYFYDVADDRSSIEWIREIAHEFSHLAFRPIGGNYTFPEAFANGYLGERLLVRWLARGSGGGPPSVVAAWGRTFGGYPNFQRLLIAPALKEYTSHGLNKKELARRDDVGMRYMIGMMLYVDDVCGSRAVGRILQNIADQHSTDPNLLYTPVKDALSKVPKKPALSPSAQAIKKKL